MNISLILIDRQNNLLADAFGSLINRNLNIKSKLHLIIISQNV